MDNKKKHKPSPRTLFKIVSPYLRKHKFRIIGGLIALVTVDLLQLFIPKILQKGVDSLTTGTTQQEIIPLSLSIIAIAASVVLLRFCWRNMIIGFSRILECKVRDTIFAHVLKMDASFFTRNSAGKVMSHSSNDLSAVQMAFGMGIVAAVDSSVMLTAAIGFMLTINAKLTLIALLPMPILAISTRILSGKLHKRFEKVQEQFSELTEFSRSTISSMRLVKAYTMEDLQTERFDALGKRYVRANLRVAVINGLMHPISTFIGNLAMLCVFFLGGRMVIQGIITLGDFVAFITYIYMIIWPMMAIGWVVNLVQRGLTSLGRIHTLLEQKSLITDGPTLSATHLAPTLHLKNLTFSYPASEHKNIDGVSLSFTEGTYGITGRTGSGKTTLCRILCRLYPVPSNSLFYGGEDVNNFALTTIRNQTSYVSQEPSLFSESILTNISFGNENASREEIEEAARHAVIHDDIMRLEQGYNTLVGERGVKLSGGQRQRLALARALLARRPILLIDDGLSAVDVETEHLIFSKLKEHAHNKVIIIISNRIKLLSMTDEVIILEEGRVQHRGTHQDILAQSSLYQSMAEKQQDGEERA